MPWLFDDEAVEVLRTFTRLKAQLMPYIYGQAVVDGPRRDAGAAADGCGISPTTRLVRTWTGSTCSGIGCWSRPCSRQSGETSYYIPAGTWTHLQTGATVRGPAWVSEVCDFLTVPVFVRPGTVLPIGARDDRPDYPYDEDVTLRVYEFADGDRTTVTVPDTTGELASAFEVTRDDGTSPSGGCMALRHGGCSSWACPTSPV